MNKKVIIGVVVVIVAAAVWWMMSSKQASAPTGATAVKGGTETVYDQQLNGLDDASMSAEMQGLDANISNM